MHQYLFSYGTLQFPEVQMQLFGRLLEGDMDILMGYEKAPIEITDERFIANGGNRLQQIAIASDPGNGILGMAFILTEEELLKADKYEPVGYKRILVNLQSGIQAWIYVQG